MTSARTQVAALPVVQRYALVGSTAALVLGGLVGLVLGLLAYPPTAWFAVLEVGVPAGIAGAALGASVGLVTGVVQRLSHR
jgi:hypothetical protein